MLPEVRKILYCTDLSKNSIEVFKHACYLAKKTGAEIHILHIVEKLSNDAKFTLQTYVTDAKSRQGLLQARVRNAHDKLTRRQDSFWDNINPDDSHVRKQVKSINVVEAYPAEMIIRYSKDLGVDLIVMGTHDKGFMHNFLGSVAKNVSNRSYIPMLIVPIAQRERLNRPNQSNNKITK